MGISVLKGCCGEPAKRKKSISELTRTDTDPKPIEGPFNIIEIQQHPSGKKISIKRTDGSPDSEYELIEEINDPAYGNLLKVKHKNTKQIWTIKKLSKALLKEKLKHIEIENEIKILGEKVHPNINKFFEIFEDEDYYYFIIEFCSQGNLCEHFHHFKKFKENVVKKILYDVFSALSYFHFQKNIYGDIRIESILIHSDTASFKESVENNTFFDNDFEAKLAYLTSSKLFRELKTISLDQDIFYKAPEQLKGQITEKSDIWSCGVLMYLLLSGEPPFTGEDSNQVKEKILLGEFSFPCDPFKYISYNAKDLINKCLTYSPEERISALDALVHPFFNNYGFEDILEDNEKEENISISLTHQSRFFQVMLVYLTQDYIRENPDKNLREIFVKEDSDKDGKISQKQLGECCEKVQGIKLSEAELYNIMKKVDFDFDGYVNYPEFIQVAVPLDEILTEERMKKGFELLEKGAEEIQEMKEVEEIFGSKPKSNLVQELKKEINKTEKDEFSYEEFKNLFLHIRLNNI